MSDQPLPLEDDPDPESANSPPEPVADDSEEQVDAPPTSPEEEEDGDEGYEYEYDEYDEDEDEDEDDAEEVEVEDYQAEEASEGEDEEDDSWEEDDDDGDEPEEAGGTFESEQPAAESSVDSIDDASDDSPATVVTSEPEETDGAPAAFEQGAIVARDASVQEEPEPETETASVAPLDWTAALAADLSFSPRESRREPPRGLARADANGLEMIDAMAGRCSPFGFGFADGIEAIRAAAEELGDGAALRDTWGVGDETLRTLFAEYFGKAGGIDPRSLYVCPTADIAIEVAIELSRKQNPDIAYRTITLVGSDHGRTGVCRTASGRPELHEGYGPMMAGFSHVPAGDMAALRSAIDEQTACVLLSPVTLHDAASPLDADYLRAVRQLCDEQDVLMIVDESRLGFASSVRPLATLSVAEIEVDAVVLSAGLFAGMHGGIVLTSSKFAGPAICATADCPLQVAVATATVRWVIAKGLPATAEEAGQELAVSVAHAVEGFEFVRDLHVSGGTIGIEMDIESKVLVDVAANCGLRVEPAGETSVRLQLPPVIRDEDREALLQRLSVALETIERAATGVTA